MGGFLNDGSGARKSEPVFPGFGYAGVSTLTGQHTETSNSPSAMRLVVQGEYDISDDPSVILSTLLGSCVATCLCDPVARVGGMNHFLLAGSDAHAGPNERYGSFAMEVLVNALLKLGAKRSRLEAKLFGGATMGGRMARIGEANCAFAKSYLETERIPLISSSLGGERARRLRYTPVTGQAQMLFVSEEVPAAMPARLITPEASGDVDLF